VQDPVTQLASATFVALMERYVRSHSASVPETEVFGDAVLPMWADLGRVLRVRAAKHADGPAPAPEEQGAGAKVLGLEEVRPTRSR
jgi:hypothetical protein